MKEKKFTPLMWCHLALMAVLTITSIVAAIFLLAGAGTIDTTEVGSWKTSIVFVACVNVANAAALIAGVIYLLKGYRKDAANYYKAFIMLIAVAATFSALASVFIKQSDAATDSTIIASNTAHILGILFMVTKVVLLSVLAFKPDLGKRNTWIIFGVILAIDLIFGFLYQSPSNMTAYRFATVLPRLFMDGTIGLAIKGKYDDKDARGTI